MARAPGALQAKTASRGRHATVARADALVTNWDAGRPSRARGEACSRAHVPARIHTPQYDSPGTRIAAKSVPWMINEPSPRGLPYLSRLQTSSIMLESSAAHCSGRRHVIARRAHRLRLLLTLLVASGPAWGLVPGPPEGKTVRIGVLGPITSTSRSFGIGHLQGIRLCVDEYNRARTPDDPVIELRIEDDQADPDESLASARRLIEDGVAAVFGPCNSACAEKILKNIDLEDSQTPFVSAMTTATRLTDELKNDYYFRCNVSDKKRIETLLQRMHEDFAPRRIVLLYEPDTYGAGLKEDCMRWYRQNKPNLLRGDIYPLSYERNVDSSSASEVVDRMLQQNYGTSEDHAILILGIAPDAVTLLRALRAKKVRAKIYLPEPNHRLFEREARAGLDVTDVRVFSVFWPEGGTTETYDFRKSFAKKFHEEPSFSEALSYDAAAILIEAIREVASRRPDIVKNTAAFRAELRDTLATRTHRPTTFALNATHKFTNQEYSHISFSGLKFKSDAELIRWQRPLPLAAALTAPAPLLQIAWPSAWILLLVAGAGAIGSVLRSLHHDRSGFLRTLRDSITAETFLVNPAIALLVFHTIFLILVFSNSKLVRSGIDTGPLYYISGSVIGCLAGFVGIRSIYHVLDKLGISASPTHAAPAPGPSGAQVHNT